MFRMFLFYPKSTIVAILFIVTSIVCAALGIPSQFDYKGWIVICVIALMLLSMMNEIMPAHFALLLALSVLMFTQIISTSQALSGFSSSAVLTVAILYVVAAGLTETGALNYFMNRFLGNPPTLASAQLRMILPVAFLSAFLNNTPLVAIMIPIIQSWAAKAKVPVSQLFMPLSFAAILGGTCTLIGTSTNLVVSGKAEEDLNRKIGLFDLGVVGIPVLLSGVIYIILFAPCLLPDGAELKRRQIKGLNATSESLVVESAFEKLKREVSFVAGNKTKIESTEPLLRAAGSNGPHLVPSDINTIFDNNIDNETLNFACYVNDTSPVVDKSVVDAKLRGLNGLFLTSVQRRENLMQAIGPEFVLAAGDILYFSGVVDNFTEFCREYGFIPVTSENEDHLTLAPFEKAEFSSSLFSQSNPASPTKEFSRQRSSTFECHLTRVRVKSDGDLATKTPKEVDFRKRYQAAILSIFRRGQKLDTRGNLGRTILYAGDELIVLNADNFSWDNPSTKRDLSPVVDVVQSENIGEHVIKNEQILLEKEFIFSMMVSNSTGLIGARSLVGESIESAGLRGLPGLFLIAIEREGSDIKRAVGSDEILQKDDILWFVGERNSVAVLRRIPGLVLPHEKQVEKLRLPKVERRLVECVISLNSEMIGKTIRETKFRSKYRAAVIAVHREGHRILKKIGDITLRPGDVLILDTGAYFLQRYRDDKNFLLVAEVEDSGVPQFGKFYIALIAVITMMAVYTTVDSLDLEDISVSLFECAVIASAIMIYFKILTPERAMNSVSLEVYITVACAFGLGKALENSNVAQTLGDGLVSLAEITNTGEIGVLTAVYLATFLLSIIIANNAAALLMFPIAVPAMQGLTDSDESLTKVLFVLMLAASSCFSSPFGYQTNLMVYGPGQYVFLDFVKFGMPMQIWQWVFSVAFVASMDKWYYSWGVSFVAFLIVAWFKLWGSRSLVKKVSGLFALEKGSKEDDQAVVISDNDGKFSAGTVSVV